MSSHPSERRTGAVTSLDHHPLAADCIVFNDRHDAGRRLAALLAPFARERPVVVGIPRGGVPVAAEVARALAAPLDVAVVRKIGAPQNPEYAIGALAEGGVHVLSEQAVRRLGLSVAELETLTARVDGELRERVDRYRGEREPVALAGRTVILIDDGLATGRSALVAVRSMRERGAARVILAVPVAAKSVAHALRHEVDELVCAELPDDLRAVGLWYRDFAPTANEEVVALLAESRRTRSLSTRDGDPPSDQLADAVGPAPASGQRTTTTSEEIHNAE